MGHSGLVSSHNAGRMRINVSCEQRTKNMRNATFTFHREMSIKRRKPTELGPSHTIIGQNRQLVTDEPVEFEKEPAEIQDYRKNTNHFRGIYRNIPQFNERIPEDVNMSPVGLANTRISTGCYAHKPP